MKLPVVLRIKSIRARSAFRLQVLWESGYCSVVDFSEAISLGGVLGVLADSKAFSAFRVSEHRQTIEWPNYQDEDGFPMISIDADALWRMGSPGSTILRKGRQKASCCSRMI